MSAEENKQELLKAITRRHFVQQAGYGIGTLALSALLQESSLAPASAAPSDAGNPLGPKKPHFPAKAKNIIYLFMAGAPSQLDLFDPKPILAKYDGQPCPADLLKGERFAFIKGTPRLLGSPYKFDKVGNAGHTISELLPHLREVADDVTFVHSM